MEHKDVLLKVLFEKEKLHFRAIVDESEIANPNIVKRELDVLRQKGFVGKDRQLKKGKKVFYFLTEKGRKETMHVIIENMNESLKTVQKIADVLLSDRSKLEEWKKMSREAILGYVWRKKDMTLDERLNDLKTEHYRIYGPLQESYKNLHKLICRLTLPSEISDNDMFIGFTKKGGLCFIPSELLNEKDLS